MTVSIFLDVDKTLTIKHIQAYYADALGCQAEYDAIEADFQNKAISSREFGMKIIDLYASKGLNQNRAREIAKSVQLQPWTDELLRLDAKIFLVSTGPNYYIDQLAQEYRIPRDHVLCTNYFFEGAGGAISRCDPCDEIQKADWVKSKIRENRHNYSIGVGDSPLLDGPFIASCSIGFLIEPSDSHFFAPHFQAIIRHAKTMISLVETLSGDKDHAPVHLEEVPISKLYKRLTLGSWGIVITVIAGAFALGVKFDDLMTGLQAFGAR